MMTAAHFGGQNEQPGDPQGSLGCVVSWWGRNDAGDAAEELPIEVAAVIALRGRSRYRGCRRIGPLHADRVSVELRRVILNLAVDVTPAVLGCLAVER
jgi:hypothetical protein